MRLISIRGLPGALALLVAAIGGCGPLGSLNGTFYCTSDSDCLAGETCDRATSNCQALTPPDAGEAIPDAGPGTPDAGPHDAGSLPVNVEYICHPCSSNADCGGGGDLCLSFSGHTGRFCGSACTSDNDCPAGNTCVTIQGSGKNCYPSNYECPGSTIPDAGAQPVDAGTTHPDAGTTHPDAGMPPVDAGPMQCTPDTWGNFAQSFFLQNCDNCHSHHHDFGASINNVISDQSSVTFYISTGLMPQGATLDSTTKSRIMKWLSCGEPQ